MKVPNWQHHSKKESKRTLKPQALRQAKQKLQNVKMRYMTSKKRRSSSIMGTYDGNKDASTTGNQVTTSEVACY